MSESKQTVLQHITELRRRLMAVLLVNLGAAVVCFYWVQPLMEKLLELGSWMADYYCCSYEQTIKALLPGAVRRGSSNRGKRRFSLEGF